MHCGVRSKNSPKTYRQRGILILKKVIAWCDNMHMVKL